MKKTVELPIMFVNAPESMIQDEGDKLAKQGILRYVKVTMSELKTEYIF